MNDQQAEQRAILFCENNKNIPYLYKGEQGTFEILDDMNCCAPTNAVLFSFQTGKRRYVMEAAQLLEAAAQAKKVPMKPPLLRRRKP